MRCSRWPQLQPVFAGFLIALGFVGIQALRPATLKNRSPAPQERAGFAGSVPILASDRIDNSSAFHRITFAAPVSASTEVLFRDPRRLEPVPAVPLAARPPLSEPVDSAGVRPIDPALAARTP